MTAPDHTAAARLAQEYLTAPTQHARILALEQFDYPLIEALIAQNAALVEALEKIRAEAEAGFEATANSRWEIVYMTADAALALARPKEEPHAD